MTLASQNLPVATLYGDVQIRFADWVRHLTHYDPSKWTCTSESAEEKVTVSLQSRVEIIRSEHVRFISDLARYNNEVGLSLSLSNSLSLSLTLSLPPSLSVLPLSISLFFSPSVVSHAIFLSPSLPLSLSLVFISISLEWFV